MALETYIIICMNKYRIINPNNREVRNCKSNTTVNKLDPYSSLKKNKPLLDPQNNNKKMNTNNKID